MSFAALAALASADGGYFPTAWGWTALGLMWVAALALVLSPAIELTRLELGALAGWAALAAWTWLSIAWSKDAGQSVLEGERLLVFVAGVGALVLLARRISASTVIGGVLAGISVVSAYSLATRLFPERIGDFDSVAGYRLAAIDLFDEVACAPRSARRVVEDLVPSNATPANRLFAVDRDPLEGRAPVRAGE